MNLNAYERTRPFAYHLTARANLDRIRAHRRLESTLRLMRASAYTEVATRRLDHIELTIEVEEDDRTYRPRVAGAGAPPR